MLDFHMLTAFGRFEAGEIDANAVLARWAELREREERMGDSFGQLHTNYFTWCAIMDAFVRADEGGRKAVAREWLERAKWRAEAAEAAERP